MPPEPPTAAKEWTSVVASLPSAPKARRACLVAIAMELGLPLGDVLLLAKDLPVRLPRRLVDDRAQALIDLIVTQGGRGTVEPAIPGPTLSCGEHPAFDATSVCSRCDVPTCLAAPPAP